MKLTHALAVAAFAFAFATAAQAQSATDHAAHHAPTASATTAMAAGEVRKIDKEQAKLTLKHGRIENLDMPGMTMVFKVANPKLLEGLKVGDKVKFAADNVNGALTVTAIETSK
jgi:Cu/Ag efflux protein CusF